MPGMKREKLVETISSEQAWEAVLTDGCSLKLIEGTLNEGVGAGLTRLAGVGGRADIINLNGRKYTRPVYLLATERAQKLIEQGRFLGEVDHPDWMGSLKGAAFIITSLTMDGDLMKFEAGILETPSGKMLEALLRGGVGVGVSTRGFGSGEWVEPKDGEPGYVLIGEDFQLEGIDAVLFPSNEYGTLRTTESHEFPNSSEESHMTVEKLRAEHADLVEAIETAAREGYVAQSEVDTQLESARVEAREGLVAADEVEAKVAEAIEAGKKVALESEEVQTLRTVVAGIKAALTPVLPVAEQVEEEQEASEAAKANAELEDKLAAEAAARTALESRFAAVETELNEAKAEKVRLEKEAAQAEVARQVEAHVSEVLKDSEFADLLRDQLVACESVEKVDEVFAKENARYESLAARLRVTEANANKGVGEAEVQKDEAPEGGETGLSEAQKKQRRMAGLPV
jgi:hypothetical protein